MFSAVFWRNMLFSGPKRQQICHVGPYVRDTGDGFLSIFSSYSWGPFGETVLVAISPVNS